MLGECPSETSTTGKTPQANPDQSLVYDTIDLKMFESFFLLGASKTKIGKSDCNPEILYEFGGENTSPSIKKVLANFCFPTQFRCKPVRYSTSEEEINSIIFGQDQELRGSNCYIFTLNSQEIEDGLIEYPELPNSERERIYCICVQTEDIGVELSTSLEYINSKCLCLLSYIPCFELHFNLLLALQQLKKL